MSQKRYKYIIWVLLVIIVAQSCTTSKKMVYMNNLKYDTLNLDLYQNAETIFHSKIQKNDLLWITVGGPNSADLIALNSAAGVSAQMGGAAIANQQGGQIIGYLVESDGSIKIPYAGSVKVEGLTRVELEELLRIEFMNYTKEPVVNVRFMNYKVTVLGEVARPGTFQFPNERMTLLEAIGLAGDLTVMGERSNVLVVREVDGKREIGRVNLLSKDLLLSPFFYLKTNDVVYIEPSPAKFFARERIPQFITLAASGLSLLLTAFTISKL